MKLRFILSAGCFAVLAAGCEMGTGPDETVIIDGVEEESPEENTVVEEESEPVSFEVEEEDLTSDAAEKVRADFENGNLEQKLFEYEKRFSRNDGSYLGDTEADSQEAFIEGSGPVLVSAPHTTSHIRDGEQRPAEIYTGSMALLVHKYTDAHVLYNVYEGEDANSVAGGTYKEELGRIVEEYDIELVLDLHGAGRSREFDLDIGTNYGETVSEEQVELLTYSLNERGIGEVYENHTFAASQPNTITNYTWNELDTEAMQLEIHSDYRNPREDVESYYRMLESLVFFVENAG
ncbi:hypothetical protein [Alteribacter natronophilus]|uniref:hypothetical protein n=1 Tax=Alteribacter natronophilus TaxID=2583810 RepID=UPI00110D63A1|nr:hypothetical protein [Alteribacter natronophilus]TMW71236.1 hypothetical protein FGB90_14895 [Alteribacter natronophilus]